MRRPLDECHHARRRLEHVHPVRQLRVYVQSRDALVRGHRCGRVYVRVLFGERGQVLVAKSVRPAPGVVSEPPRAGSSGSID